MSKLHLLCELNDENYTLASFSFYENFQDAVQNAIKACKEWNEDCEVHAGKELRITANCGDSFMLQRLNRFGLSLEHIFLYGIMDIKVLISRCDTRALTKIVRKQWKRKSRSLKMISDCMIKTSTTM